jgi:hypothetical protein
MYYEEIRKGEVLDALDKDLFLQKPIRNEESTYKNNICRKWILIIIGG